MLRLIAIALVVMFNSPEQFNSNYLLVEVADESQVKNIETPENGKGGNGKFQGRLRPLNSESLGFINYLYYLVMLRRNFIFSFYRLVRITTF